MQNEDKKVMDQYATGEIKAVEPSENKTSNDGCDICGAKGQVTEKLDTHSMNYYNHCNKKECIEYSDLEPSEQPKKWEEYYTNAVDQIEKKFSHRNRQWCHDQLNRALDNTEFHHMADVVSEDKYDDVKCQMIDEILAGEFGINTHTPYLDWAEDSIGDALFELREWIVEQWLNDQKDEFQHSECLGSDPLNNPDCGFEQYNKYNLLQDAMEKLNEKESER